MKFQENKISPHSPSQTRPFLQFDEEILYIGSAKEIQGLQEFERYLALTDIGRMLVLQNCEVMSRRSSNSASLSSSLRSSFASAKNRVRSSSFTQKTYENINVESPQEKPHTPISTPNKEGKRSRAQSMGKTFLKIVKSDENVNLLDKAAHQIEKGEEELFTTTNTKTKSYMVIQNVKPINLECF
eukprot:NODE_354_length_8925_cov_1.106050.p5 type:complete len:185 gc:universal NODE_354_length_8925_cov_1.106050:4059-4613(+)